MKTFPVIAAVAALALNAGPAFAGQDTSDIGSQAATWLELPNSAKTAAMGGASMALADDVNTLSVNPAGLGGLSGQQVSLMDNSYVQDSYLEHVAYGLGLGGSDGLAVSLDYMNYGSIQTDTVANGVLVPTGSISPYGEGLDLGYGHCFATSIGDFLMGATGELVGENLTGGAAGATASADLGLLWRQAALDGFSLGAGVQHLGGQLDGADLPTAYQAGLAYRLSMLDGQQGLALAADASVPAADAAAQSLSVGAQYSGNTLWAVRGGYKFVGDNGVGGLSVGGGLTYSIASLDYAFVSEGVLGNANQVSLSAKF